MSRRYKKKINTRNIETLIKLVALLMGLMVLFSKVIIRLCIRILSFSYDAITIYTSGYKVKSGNGIFKTFFDKGRYGEFVLYRKVVNNFGKDYVYTNVYLENQNTDNTEIDVIALSSHGVYVFEMKNYSGYIYGSKDDQTWTQVLNRFSKNKFYNPLRQNYAHTKAVENYLELDNDKIIPVVVFANHSNLHNVDLNHKFLILRCKDVNKMIINNKKRRAKILSQSQLKEYSIKLIERSNMPEEAKNKHIEQVKELIAQTQSN